MVALLFTILAILFYATKLYYRKFYLFEKSLKRFPTPPEVPILGHSLDFLSDKGFMDVLLDYVKTYGETVRVKTGPKRQMLVTSNYNFIQFILTSTQILKKSEDYNYFYRWLGTGLLTSDGAKWKQHRQIITPTFHYQILEDYVEVFEANGKILAKKFEKFLNQTVDIYDMVNLCTLDIICESAMGTSVKAQEDTESEYAKSVKTILNIVVERSFSPHKMFDWIYFCTQDYQREKEALKVIHSYTWNVINSRQKTLNLKENGVNQRKRKAFLDLLLEINLEKQILTLEEIREEVDTFMFAGHDTTGTAISFILYCLSNNPEEQEKVINEQKDILENNLERSLTLQDLKKMKYLELVIKESMRLYPSVPMIARKLTEDVVFEDKTLPKGLTVALFLFALHRDPKYFPEPEMFKPERFQNFDGTRPFIYLPFSAGPRNCLGQKFAMLVMKSVVSRIVRSFRLLPTVPEHKVKLVSEAVLLSTNGVKVRLAKRQ